jgi:hypothetical protein
MVLTPTGRRTIDDIDEALAAYALALDPQNDPAGYTGFLSQHVRECEACRRRLDGYAEVASDLALSVQPRRPPASLLHDIATAALVGDTPDDPLVLDASEHEPATTRRAAAKRPI